jgi:4-amino-4-deoxychorismate lyase
LFHAFAGIICELALSLLRTFCFLSFSMTAMAAGGHILQAAGSSDFYIFTSYLWNNSEDVGRGRSSRGNHYFFPYHRNRLVSTAQAFDWAGVVCFLSGVAGLERLRSIVVEHLKNICESEQPKGARKVKVCVYKDNRVHVESAAVGPTGLMDISSVPPDLTRASSLPPTCIVKLDVEPTTASLFTTHKTSERRVYERARRAADIVHEPPTIAEVLLFNHQDEIMECSLCTPYFHRNGRWVTPPLSSGGNAGVTRRLALEAGLCDEQVVLVESLRQDETIWISNGVRGFIPATVRLYSPT